MPVSLIDSHHFVCTIDLSDGTKATRPTVSIHHTMYTNHSLRQTIDLLMFEHCHLQAHVLDSPNIWLTCRHTPGIHHCLHYNYCSVHVYIHSRLCLDSNL